MKKNSLGNQKNKLNVYKYEKRFKSLWHRIWLEVQP